MWASVRAAGMCRGQGEARGGGGRPHRAAKVAKPSREVENSSLLHRGAASEAEERGLDEREEDGAVAQGARLEHKLEPPRARAQALGHLLAKGKFALTCERAGGRVTPNQAYLHNQRRAVIVRHARGCSQL